MTSPQIDVKGMAIRDRIFLSLLHFFGRLPMPVLQGLGARIGWLAGRMRRSSPYRVVRCNLELCFPDKSPTDIDHMVRANLAATAPVAFEFAKIWGNPTAYGAQQIHTIHNEHIFHEALLAGRGTLALSPHFGTFELMNAWLVQHTKQTIMYKPGKDKGVNAFIVNARSRSSTIVPADESGVRDIFKVLKKGGFSAILPDQVPQDNNGIYAPFFGISTWTGVLVPRLVARTGCTVIMMSCLRRPDGNGFDIFIDRPDPEIYNPDLLTAVTAMNRTIEALIQREPTHYYWFYKRFKKNESLPDPYRRQVA